jgi:hypothetical protein
MSRYSFSFYIVVGIVNVSAFLFWYHFVFKGGAKKLSGKTFLLRGTIFPPMSENRLKTLATVLYIFFLYIMAKSIRW